MNDDVLVSVDDVPAATTEVEVSLLAVRVDSICAVVVGDGTEFKYGRPILFKGSKK